MSKLNQAMQDLMRYNAAILPQKRSVFNKNHSHLTTLDSAYLVPLMYDRVVPGDEKKIRYSGLARMATPIHPTMDEAYLDVWAFYVPDRLWWNHAKEFYGENLDASFNPDGEYEMPTVGVEQYMLDTEITDNPTNSLHSLCDYFGLPIAKDQYAFLDTQSCRINVGLFRSYQKIWNDYYRNTSIQPALRLNDGDTVTNEEWNVIKQIRKVNKLPDMFTMLLREPQAGDDVLLPIGEYAPVVPIAGHNIPKEYGTVDPATYSSVSGNKFHGSPFYAIFNPGEDGYSMKGDLLVDGEEASATWNNSIVPNNLFADLSSASATSINQLRSAITVQQLLELDAIGGKRYQNILQAHFGVFTPDATLQRPELLGATRTPIGMRQVLQTSSTDATSPQGNTAAVSVTNVANEWICNKAFTEPGYILVLGAIRPIHSYSQGVDPLLRKKSRYDHYWPVFENLGNQPVMLSDIYATPDQREFTDGLNPFTKVFGYKEAWQEYRFKANRVSGLMRPDAPGTLASWNYTSYFAEAPLLDSNFVSEDPNLIDRTIAVQNEPQFILDSYFEYSDIKNMGVHSIPGLTRL